MLSDINIYAEIFLISLITIIIIFLTKVIKSIKIKGKENNIPVAIIVIFLGFITGLILRAIDQDFSFKVVPHFSMISIIILFIAFGTMIDYKQFKKFGIWTIILGTIPYLIEWIALTIIIIVTTNLIFSEAGIISALIAMCSPGVISPKIIDNIKKGYEKETNYNNTISLASAIENVFGLILMIILIVIYIGNYSVSASGSNYGIIILTPILLLLIGLFLGIFMSLIIIEIFKPLANLLFKNYLVDESKLNGEELNIAKKINNKAKNRNNIFVWILMVLLFASTYAALQFTIGIGFLIMESALICGIIISIFSEKDIETKETQKSIANNSNIFYTAIGCFVVWGFGGMLIDPNQIVGNDWFVGKNNNPVGIPNIITAIFYIFIGILFRILAIFAVMSFNKEYTLRQKIYTIPAMLTTGTPSVNNGVTILVILGITSTTPLTQQNNALLLQNIMIVTGSLMTFLLIPIGSIILGWGQDKLIFKWENISEGQYNSKLKKSLKEEKINDEIKINIKQTIKEFWNEFYNLKNENAKFEKEKNAAKEKILIDIDLYNKKIKKTEINKLNIVEEYKLKFLSLKNVLDLNLKEKEKEKHKEIKEKYNFELKKIKWKEKKQLKKNKEKEMFLNKNIEELKKSLEVEKEKKHEKPKLIEEIENKLINKHKELKLLINKNIKNNELNKLTNSLIN